VNKPCTFYGIPCEAGSEGNCICRRRFFRSEPLKHGQLERLARSELDELLPAEDFSEGGSMFTRRDAEALRDETDRLALGGDPDDAF
jgi:hypothetical protein